ncbi:MAG TPA: DUF4232 domain-containing protein [Streptosporangiaceae bacterium]|nr:DUF4232 domain-containing protein [Streptosporangiaceae bacterium]
MFPRVEHSRNGIRGTAAALIVLASVAGCSSSSSSSSSTPASSPGTSSAAAAGSSTAAPPPASLSPAVTGPAPCATSDLNVTLGASSGYAGGVDVTIVFTNTSGTTCTLYGYPGVSLVSAPPYTQIGLAAQRGTTTPVKLITLATGATASAVVQIVDALNFPPATCGPTKAAFLRIYPPNQTAPVYLANTSEACAQPVQTLSVTAVQAGSGGT